MCLIIDVNRGTHPGTGFTPGKFGKLPKPRSSDYLSHHKATFRDKLLLIGSHIQWTPKTSTFIMSKKILVTKISVKKKSW